MVNLVRKTQELGMKMMAMKDKNMGFMEIWNDSQVYIGQTIAIYAGDLYALELCMDKLKEIKHP